VPIFLCKVTTPEEQRSRLLVLANRDWEAGSA
jgi:hypothetical protein